METRVGKKIYEKARISEECLFLDLGQDHENTNNENDLADKQGFNLGISSWNFYNTIQLIYILLWIFI